MAANGRELERRAGSSERKDAARKPIPDSRRGGFRRPRRPTSGVQWTAGHLVYTLDGKNWAQVTNTNVPSTPMNLDIQTQAWACGTSTWEQCPNASTPAQVNLDVDWVVAYARD